MSWKSSTAVVHKLSGVEIDTALIRIAKQHRWITSASFTAGVLSARIRQAEWPLTVDQHNIIHMARAAAIIDQLCRVAIHASVKWGDDESWGTIRHTADEHANMIPSFEKLELWINPEDYAGRMTRSRVRVLPVMSIRSTKTRLPSTTSKLMSTVRFAGFLVTCGRISTKAYPACPA